MIGHVAQGVRPLILALDPDAVLLGGELAENGQQLRSVLTTQIASLGLTPPSIHVVEGSVDAIMRGAPQMAVAQARDAIASSLMAE
ncbi:hypothetical protein GCM10025789_21990 [Tessaracoccus lubricantis]|uniref:ROK family protein n=1 Tax=Tessaracoccus lubricantis TaxID=545543 RepID=A0ABP9FKC9_9ACTN